MSKKPSSSADANRAEGLGEWLTHLENHPEDDADCVLEVKLPLSVMTKLMLQGAREQSTPQDLIRDALNRAGFTAALP